MKFKEKEIEFLTDNLNSNKDMMIAAFVNIKE